MVKAFLVLSLQVILCKICNKYNSMWVYVYMCVKVKAKNPTSRVEWDLKPAQPLYSPPPFYLSLFSASLTSFSDRCTAVTEAKCLPSPNFSPWIHSQVYKLITIKSGLQDIIKSSALLLPQRLSVVGNPPS